MPQTTRSSSSRAAGGRTRTKKQTSRNGSSGKGRTTSRSSRNGASASRSRTRSQSSNGPVEKTTEKVSQLASKAKTPLVAGGAALAGIAGGLALKSRSESKRPTKMFSAVQLPKSLRNIDLDQLIDAGRRVRSIGEQVGDVADTAEKTHKKHK